MSRGRVCQTEAPAGMSQSVDNWVPISVGLSSGRLVWVMQHGFGVSYGGSYTVLTTRPGPPCGPLGKTGRFRFRPQTKLFDVAVDGRWLVYTNGRKVLRHRLPAKPSYAPPANDDFEHAAGLPTDAPATVSGRVANATRQPGEPPLGGATRTVWYAYRPTVSRTVYVKLEPFGLWSWDVFTGSSFDDLTEVPRDPSSGQFTRIDAVAGHTYWIAVGTREPSFQPFRVNLTWTAPPYE
jgi:hypothetical protein